MPVQTPNPTTSITTPIFSRSPTHLPYHPLISLTSHGAPSLPPETTPFFSIPACLLPPMPLPLPRIPPPVGGKNSSVQERPSTQITSSSYAQTSLGAATAPLARPRSIQQPVSVSPHASRSCPYLTWSGLNSTCWIPLPSIDSTPVSALPWVPCRASPQAGYSLIVSAKSSVSVAPPEAVREA